LELDCTVALAYDGGAALRTLVAAPVDLLLLDVALPDRDGLWLAHYVKTDPAYRELPVLIVTGAEPWPVLARLQVAHYLPKPFDFWTLVNQVRLPLGLPTVRPEPLWADEQAAGRHGTRPAQR
jgi:CheY-like chemotaxis protein